MDRRHAKTSVARIPGAICALGLVSLCMDISSEMIHALLPEFLVSVIGTGTITVGLIEGIAEATASITKVFSGVPSDRWGRRKPLALHQRLLVAALSLFLVAYGGWQMVQLPIDIFPDLHRPRVTVMTEAPGFQGSACGVSR